MAQRPSDPRPSDQAIRPAGKNCSVDLIRIAWLVTVLVCLVVVTILAVQGYVGYAAVTLAVALAAAVNLF